VYQYRASFVRVIDGDTAVLDVDLGFYIWMKEIHFRFAGIDAPEKDDKQGWQAATDYVQAFFDANPVVTINVYDQDKYGRWLVEILEADGTTLNKAEVVKGLAVPYMTDYK